MLDFDVGAGEVTLTFQVGNTTLRDIENVNSNFKVQIECTNTPYSYTSFAATK